MKLDDERRIAEVRFSGHGCAISQASASMASDEVLGMPVDELIRLRSEEHTSELQSRQYLVCRLLLEKKKQKSHKGSAPGGERRQHTTADGQHSLYRECLIRYY